MGRKRKREFDNDIRNSSPKHPHKSPKKGKHRDAYQKYRRNRSNRNEIYSSEDLPSISATESAATFTWIECEYKCRPQNGTFPDKKKAEREKIIQRQLARRRSRTHPTPHRPSNGYDISNTSITKRKKRKKKAPKRNYEKEKYKSGE